MSLGIGRDDNVDTAQLDECALQMQSVADRCAGACTEAAAARLITLPPRPSAQWSTASDAIALAEGRLASLSEDAASLSRSLSAASGLYVDAESTASGLFDAVTSVGGAVGGTLMHGMVTVLLASPIGMTAAAGTVAALKTPWGRSLLSRTTSVLGAPVAAWLRDHPEAARSPETTMLVRGLVSGSDETVKSALGMPMLGSVLVQSPALSVAGVATALGSLGVSSLAESPVTVRATGTQAVRAPGSISELAGRIPHAEEGKPQIRVERYGGSAACGKEWVVYVGGTVDMGVGGDDEAFDMESNAALMADADGGSYRAAEQAMSEAGVAAEDPVTVVGHSQGGLVAERIAQSGDYDVKTLVTFGAPSTDAPLPDGVDAYAVEHRGDVVPALGGIVDDSGRTVVLADAPPGDGIFGAHSLDGYVRSASQMDASLDPSLGPLSDAIDGIGGSDPAGDATDYRATRTEEATADPPAASSRHGGGAIGPEDRMHPYYDYELEGPVPGAG